MNLLSVGQPSNETTTTISLTPEGKTILIVVGCIIAVAVIIGIIVKISKKEKKQD